MLDIGAPIVVCKKEASYEVKVAVGDFKVGI
jgi:hypothetical protein